MCMCELRQAPIDLLRAVAVVMVTEEEGRKISDLLSPETEVLTEYRTRTHRGTHTHSHTKPME